MTTTSQEKETKTSYADALTSLTAILAQRENELNEWEARLKKDQERFDLDRSATYGDTNPSDIIELNVGGTPFSTFRRTLTSIPESMLAAKFSGRWDDSMEKDKSGRFFIDQNPELFRAMLDFLINKANGVQKYPPTPPDHKFTFPTGLSIVDFYRMLDYFGMTNGVYATYLKPMTTGEVEIINTKKVIAKDWATVHVCRNNHSRKVKIFEVVLGDVQRIQIGWSSSSPGDDSNDGVGEYAYSYGLDLTRSSFYQIPRGYSSARRSATATLQHPIGTKIRCDHLNWYVDDEAIVIEDLIESDLDGFVPTISLKGDLELTYVELCDQ